jgi:cellulose synthase/poly-beta-1,6-N-acetylglucosamine synthase-like glycosyltransferase
VSSHASRRPCSISAPELDIIHAHIYERDARVVCQRSTFGNWNSLLYFDEAFFNGKLWFFCVTVWVGDIGYSVTLIASYLSDQSCFFCNALYSKLHVCCTESIIICLHAFSGQMQLRDLQPVLSSKLILSPSKDVAPHSPSTHS